MGKLVEIFSLYTERADWFIELLLNHLFLSLTAIVIAGITFKHNGITLQYDSPQKVVSEPATNFVKDLVHSM